MGIRWAPISVERSVPLLNETRGPFMQSTYLSSSFLTSVRSDSLLSHHKSGEQRPWSTLITCTPPRGSSLTRQVTGWTVNARWSFYAHVRACVKRGNWVMITGDEQIEFSHHISTQWDSPIPPSLLSTRPHIHLPPHRLPPSNCESPQLSVFKCLSSQNLK